MDDPGRITKLEMPSFQVRFDLETEVLVAETNARISDGSL